MRRTLSFATASIQDETQYVPADHRCTTARSERNHDAPLRKIVFPSLILAKTAHSAQTTKSEPSAFDARNDDDYDDDDDDDEIGMTAQGLEKIRA